MEEGCVDVELVRGEQEERLSCAICLQLMVAPHYADCQPQSAHRHTFGLACITEWIRKKQGARECPLCRKHFHNLILDEALAAEAEKVDAQCPDCQAVVPARAVRTHLSTCEAHLETRRLLLAKVVAEQVSWLEKQINPHLRASHSVIYETYVLEWAWLMEDRRDWKWWWWCNNPWWEGKSCPTCNELWHRYEKEIDALELRRLELLEELGIGKEEGQQQEEAVECQSA